MKKIKLLLSTLAIVFMAGCSDDVQQFVAEGVVSGADGQMLYLEEVGTGNVLSLDSVQLSVDGKFRFEHDGTFYPMFYRLRLGSATIPFAADSLTHVAIKTDAKTFFTGYTLTEADEYNHQIRTIAHLRQRTDDQIDSMLALYNEGRLDLQEVSLAIDSLASGLKQSLSTHYIYVNPKSPAAYFALFQRKGEGAYFNADQEGDDRAFAAVATAYDMYYRDAPYTPFLKDLALQAVAQARVRRQWARAAIDTTKVESKLQRIDFPEIALKDNKGVMRSLTALASESSVFLSFTAYQAQWSPALVSSIRQLHERRPDLKIYEISVDGDNYYWQNAARTLPWISVNDPKGEALRHYNVQSLPAFFLIKGSELQRIASPEEVH